MGHTSVCSAPGKVMLAGGYLILDRPHTGAVLALDQRFYSMVTVGSPTEALQPGQIAISVASPQFGELRRYVYASGPAGDNPSLRAVGESAQRPNRYIEVPLLYTLTAARALASLRAPGGAPPAAMALDITLAADNGFYSQVGELQSRGLPLTADSLASLPPLLKPMAGADGEVAKTGLGSSATLVTSLVAALLHALGIIVHLPGGEEDRYSWPANLDMVHSLAQLCHCAAQGKVGSGFDVCAATFGSQRYCRFSPAILQPVLQLPDGTAPPPRLLLLTVAPHSDGRSALDHRLEPFQLPPGIEIMMADVCCGANTPSMVRRVAAWRASHPDAAQLWTEYGAVSLILQSALIDLIELQGGEQGGAGAGAGWAEELARLGGIAPSEWEAEVTSGRAGELGSALCEVRSACLEMRSTVRSISSSSGVPIEPPEQTRLLDATMAQRGVLMAVVPGAGGADAIIALVLPSGDGGIAATRQRVGELWRDWASQPDGAPRSLVCELPVRESKPQASGHNGLQLEGPHVEAMLRRAAASLRTPTHAPDRPHATMEAVAFVILAVGAAATAALSRRW